MQTSPTEWFLASACSQNISRNYCENWPGSNLCQLAVEISVL